MTTQTADAQISKALAMLAQGDIAGAERIALAAPSTDANALHLLGMVRVRQDRLDEAADMLARALTLQPGQPQMLFNRGKILAMLGRDAEAVHTLAAAAAALPEYAEAWNSLAEIQLRMGDLAAAEPSLRKALTLQPQHFLAKLSLGVLLNNTERAEEAQTLLAQGLTQAPDNGMKAAFAYNLAEAQQALGKREAALENLAKVRALDPAGSSNLDFNRANILIELARVDEAQDLLANLVQRDPGNPEAHISYNKLLRGEKRAKKFLASFDDAPLTTALQLAKAGLLADAGRAEEAQEIYDRLLIAEPDNIQAAAGLAEGLSKLGHHPKAIATLEKALIRAPENTVLQITLAALALNGRDPQKSAAMSERVLAGAPHHQLVLALLGSAWRLMDDARHETLNGYDDLIQVFDLEPPEGYSSMAAFNAELNDFLSGLHKARHRDEVQSLRSGSMTYGTLFNARYPLVEKLRSRLDGALTRYITQMKADASHPFRGRRSNGFRYAGSWSSRLGAAGHHINHIHNQGWISSAYYVDVPKAAEDTKKQQGWIKFGEPAFEVGLKPLRTVQPVPGRLVLFPSYMWHGTTPFQGEARTTIAFDAVPR